MSVHDRDKTGKTRIRCSSVRESGSCSSRRIIYLRDIETLVLSGMFDELKDPRLIGAYARKRQRPAGDAIATRRRLEGKPDRIESERQLTGESREGRVARGNTRLVRRDGDRLIA